MNVLSLFMVHKRKIIQLDHDDNEIDTWLSTTDAANSLGIERRGISSCLVVRYKSSGGFKWKYVDETITDEVWNNHPVFNVKASNLGRIMFNTGAITIGYLQRSGYRTIGIVHEGVKLSKLTHRVIMECFNGISHLQVDHIDGNRDNNVLDNLMYMTAREHVIKTHNTHRKIKN